MRFVYARAACDVRGPERVLESLQDITGMKSGETDMDPKFSVQTTNCLPCCALGPVEKSEEETNGMITP
jgi:NADH-quinone oxidoreductase subunit E